MLKFISACRLDKDQLLSEVLRYIILRGPATAYRIARDLNLHFTQAYRKASRLERFGMARRAANHRGSMFEATERGIVTCYYFGCANWEVLIDKLAARHKLPKPALEGVSRRVSRPLQERCSCGRRTHNGVLRGL